MTKIDAGELIPFHCEQVKKEYNALPEITSVNLYEVLFIFIIRIVYRDDKCNNKYGAGMTVALRDEEDIDAYLGPPCSTGT